MRQGLPPYSPCQIPQPSHRTTNQGECMSEPREWIYDPPPPPELEALFPGSSHMLSRPLRTSSPQGWECPICHNVYAPWMSICTECRKTVTNTTQTTSKENA